MYGDNLTHVGDTYRCFTAVAPTRGWRGAWGQVWSGGRWECNECGTRINGDLDQNARYLDRHADRGHAPCEYCGKPLVRRMDGTPRQHQSNRCPGKTDGHKIEREFVKNMTDREYR